MWLSIAHVHEMLIAQWSQWVTENTEENKVYKNNIQPIKPVKNNPNMKPQQQRQSPILPQLRIRVRVEDCTSNAIYLLINYVVY